MHTAHTPELIHDAHSATQAHILKEGEGAAKGERESGRGDNGGCVSSTC